jgi:Predicted Fe-S oxidoreductases
MKYPIYKKPTFQVNIEPEDGLTKVSTGGLLSSMCEKLVIPEMSFFDRQKYIAELSENSNDPIFSNYFEKYGRSLLYSAWMPPIPSPAFKRMVFGRMMSSFGFYRPEQVTISITEECPNRCLHCALPNKNNHSKLTVEETKNAIDQAIRAGATNLIFDGGEPLGYAGLEELISYVDPKKAIACMFTSGVGLTAEKAFSLKEAGLYSVSVSIDSPFEEKHDEMRGVSGVFQKAMAGIQNALNAGFLVNMYVVLAPHNVHDLDEIWELAKKTGVHELSFYEIVPTGRWLDRKNEVLTKEQHLSFEQFIEACQKAPGPRIFSGPLVIREFGCMAGRYWLHVTPEGDILPCSCVPIPYGNVKSGKNAIQKSWKKIRADPAYHNASDCLMRDPAFRQEYEQKFR